MSGRMRHMFESTKPEKPRSYFESLPSNENIKVESPPEEHPLCTEIFGELYFRETSSSSSSYLLQNSKDVKKIKENISDGDAHMNEEKKVSLDDDQEHSPLKNSTNETKLNKSRISLGSSADKYPPVRSLSSVFGNNGKPRFYYESYKGNARFLLQEIRIDEEFDPMEDTVHACPNFEEGLVINGEVEDDLEKDEECDIVDDMEEDSDQKEDHEEREDGNDHQETKNEAKDGK